MNSQANTATILGKIETFMPDSARIPKYIELFDHSLRLVKQRWVESNDFQITSLAAGTYTLRLSLSSGVLKDETFDLAEGETKTIPINIAYNSPHESHEWAYLNKSFSVDSFRDTNLKMVDYYKEKPRMVTGSLWIFQQDHWEREGTALFSGVSVFRDGYTFNIDTPSWLSILEISGADMPNLYVSLPPANSIKGLVRLSEAVSDEEVHPIDVTVATDNFRAETLITLITNGAIREAKTLSNAKEAEELLFQKMVNPVMAAIGGYFLLKIGELNRLHDWANNLANWFKWLPDGAIIHATQLLSKKEKTETDLKLIRQRLLDAARNGLPVYSEGLRLLEKGLKQLWYHTLKSDPEIQKALDRVGDYLEMNDCSQETTTFIGISPDQPGRTALTANPAGIMEEKNDIEQGALVTA